MASALTVTTGRNRARMFLFFAAFLFGLSALLTRIATRASGMSGFQATFVRFAVGLVAVGSIFAARPGTLRARSYWLLVTRAFFGGVSALLYFQAIALVPAGVATLLNNTFPLWGVLVSFVWLGERPTLHLAAALGIAGVGVFLVLGGGEAHVHLSRGELYGIASGICGGAGVAAIRALRADHNAPTVFLSFTVGGLVVSTPALLEHWPSSPLPWVAAGAVGFTAFLAQLFMTEAYGALSVAEAAVWQQLTPIASFAWALCLGEQVTMPTLVGVTLGIGGIVYGTVLGHVPFRRECVSPERAREPRDAAPPPEG